MQRPSSYLQRRGTLDVKMTPMIDVVFLLLIFFVWTSSFQREEGVVGADVSEATGSGVSAEDFPELEIRILWADSQPRWQLNDIEVADLRELEQRLSDAFAQNEETTARIQPDTETPWQQIINVLDISRRVGVKASFATEEV